MQIEEELRTRKFKDEAHKAHLNIFFTAAWLKGRIVPFFKQFGLTMEQYNVLRIVRGAGEPIMVKDISARMIDRNSNTTRIIDRLEGKTLLRRTQAKCDRRVSRVSLTEEGRSLMVQIDAAFQAQNPHESKMCMEKFEQLNQILDELRDLDNYDVSEK